MLYKLKQKLQIAQRVIKKVNNWPAYFIDQFGFSKNDWVLKVGNLRLKLRKNSVDRWVATENLILDEYSLKNLCFDNFDSVVDLGANIGAFTVFASKKFRNAKFYCFEPNSENYSILCENIKLNKLDNQVKIFNKAVTDKNTLNVKIYDNLDSSLNSTVDLYNDFPNYLNQFTKTPKKKSYKVSNFNIKRLKGVVRGKSLLKMDVEGGEYIFFTKEHLPVLQLFDVVLMEYHNLSDRFNGDKIEKFLNNNGINNYKRTRTFFYINLNSTPMFSSPLKKLLFISRPFDGEFDNAGTQGVARHLSKSLEKSFSVTCVSRKLIKPNLSVMSVVFYDWLYPFYLALLNLFIRYPVVLINTPYQGGLTKLFKLSGSKVVILVNDIFFIDNKLESLHDKYSYLVNGISFKNADVLLATSEQTQRDIKKEFGCDSKVIYLGLSDHFDFFDQDYVSKKPPTHTVGYVGAYCKIRKRVGYFLDLLKLNTDDALKFYFAGTVTAEFKDDLASDIKNKQYEILGRVSEEDKVELFKNISFLYFPSKLEGTGLPIIEAFRAGVVPIVHKDAKIPVIIKDRCLIVKNPKQALAKIRKFVDNQNKYNKLTSENHEHSKLFSYDSHSKFLERYYE